MHSDEMSFLGLSNSEVFLAEKDSKSIKTEFLLLPTFEFLDQQQEQEEGEEFLKKKKKILVSSSEEMMMIKMPITSPAGSGDQINKLEEDEDGFRTPTSLDHKIRVNYEECPPAPKKPKSVPAAPAGAADSRKRKASSSRIFIRIDLSKEINDLLQVPSDHQDVTTATDLGSKIIKKVRSN